MNIFLRIFILLNFVLCGYWLERLNLIWAALAFGGALIGLIDLVGENK